MALLSGAMVSVSAAVELPKMFSDHAVFQRGEAVPVWGWGEPGETVTVEFGGQKVTGKADKDGAWRVELASMDAEAKGREMTVTGSSSGSAKVADVLVGEVWMASGQSNMQWSLSQTERAKEDIAAANYPEIRLFQSDRVTAATPQTKVGGAWLVTSPETVGRFSAVGYYFGLKLHQELGVPVGILSTSWGGKPSEAFTSREGLLTEPEGKGLVEQLDAAVKSYDEGSATANYEKALAAWKKKAAEIKEANKTAEKKQNVPRQPGKPSSPALQPNRPNSIYNGMIHPWVGYAMKGAIWYQGESNAGRAKQYETIFPQLILDWRRLWKKELPFYFVQLANFKKASTEPGVPDEWAELQNAQLLTLSLPKTGMAVINDIGMANNIHPTNKLDVGNRLARWALAKDYGKDGIVISGPLYKGSKIEADKVRIEFDHAKGLKSRDGGPLKRFEIAGEDQKWFWADAKIDGESVIVSSDKVSKPVAVRYAWASNPEGANLVNGEGLPASLFRTDDWKLKTER
ncbi:9-O-acetylesterase [Haloferula helveola]|uniref:9-O-acetylesterase n=1 Tax=Haloferula helveola TaxID=490095 RepID=A0ABM7R9R4_9BACT|nr:9-O-acetylesterase [Haloferula helveola]